MKLQLPFELWEHFACYWPFVRGIHLSLVDSPHKGQWSGALMFSLICAWTNGWARNRGTGDLRRYRAHYDVTMMVSSSVIANCMRNIDFLSLINFSTICILNKKFAAFHLQFHPEGVTFKTSACWLSSPAGEFYGWKLGMFSMNRFYFWLHQPCPDWQVHLAV